MSKNSKEKIIEYIKNNEQATAKELESYLNISRQGLFRNHLFPLVKEEVLTKYGKPPKVFYMLKDEEETKEVSLKEETRNIIEKNYLTITPIGERKEGLEGFVYWCQRNNLEVEKTANEYIRTLNKYNKYKKDGLINGEEKFPQTFEKVFLDKVFYLDFYSLERFGKTKLGQLLLYSKQSGNKKIIKEIADIIKPKILKIIKDYKIEAVGFIPWTIKREVQFMKELRLALNLNKKPISIEKIKMELTVPQKSLSKFNDRVENAKKTIAVTDKEKYNNVLLIDDAVGSGSTLNEVAKKLKTRKNANKVIGLAITGSFKGFDVISEV